MNFFVQVLNGMIVIPLSCLYIFVICSSLNFIDQFEEFEKQFWEHHGNETNIAEYNA